MNEITNLISNLGFPIVCVIALGYYCKSTTDKYTSNYKEMTEQNNKLMTTTIEEFKEIIVKFDSKLDTIIDLRKEDK